MYECFDRKVPFERNDRQMTVGVARNFFMYICMVSRGRPIGMEGRYYRSRMMRLR